MHLGSIVQTVQRRRQILLMKRAGGFSLGQRL